MGLYQPFISYDNDFTFLYPGVGMVTEPTRPKTVAAYDHVAGGGTVTRYVVGSRDFIRASFDWQTDAQKTEWETWWDAVKDGSWFTYHDNDSCYKCGSLTCNDGPKSGELQDVGGTDNRTRVKIVNTEFEMMPGEVYGYWRTPILEMREVV